MKTSEVPDLELVKQGGLVTRTDDEFAWVALDREAGCAGCSANSACGAGGLLMGTAEIKLENILKAKQGQRIEVGMRSVAVVSASALLFVFPVVAFLIGLSIGYAAAPAIGLLSQEWTGFIFGVIAIGISFLVIKLVSAKMAKSGSYEPIMTRILADSEATSCQV
jgi:sigma-E factor negative regulatory protein RseC